jgi:hypothetical protein
VRPAQNLTEVVLFALETRNDRGLVRALQLRLGLLGHRGEILGVATSHRVGLAARLE